MRVEDFLSIYQLLPGDDLVLVCVSLAHHDVGFFTTDSKSRRFICSQNNHFSFSYFLLQGFQSFLLIFTQVTPLIPIPVTVFCSKFIKYISMHLSPDFYLCLFYGWQRLGKCYSVALFQICYSALTLIIDLVNRIKNLPTFRLKLYIFQYLFISLLIIHIFSRSFMIPRLLLFYFLSYLHPHLAVCHLFIKI